MRLNHHIVIALSVLLSFSCNQKAKIEVVTELTETQEAVTKADTPTVLEGEFDFSVRDKDIWAYIERQKDFPRVLSIEPRVREGDTLMFIANLEQGWRIFSADKHLPPVLAEIPEGTFNQKLLDNSGLRLWMKSIMDLTCKIKQQKDLSTATDYTDLWAGYPVLKKEEGKTRGVQGLSMDPTWTRVTINQQTSYQVVDTQSPLLETKWGQGYPWNLRLPMHYTLNHYPTGCVAVAVSQLLYYYHNAINCPSGLYHGIAIDDWILHPANGNEQPYYTSSLSRTDYQNPSSRWGQMVKDYSAYISNYPSSIAGASYVSDLMVDVGNRSNMKYYADASDSGSTIEDAQLAMSSYGLSSTHITFNEPYAYSNIVNNKPLYIRGTDTGGENNIGHAWVIDGAQKYQFVNYNTYQWWMGYLVGSLPNGEEMTLEEARQAAWEIGLDKPEDGMITHGYTYSTDCDYRFHMNWGYDGQSDGYYYLTDSVMFGEDYYSFIVDLEMLSNIHVSQN